MSLPLPGRGADVDAYVAFVREIVARHAIRDIVVRDELFALADGFDLPVRPHRAIGSAPLGCPTGAGFQLVQFSSGSTQRPKPVMLDDGVLGANIRAIIDALQPRPGDVAVSWLPLSHDMGLIGMLLSSIASMTIDHAGPSRVVVLDPAQFLRRPGSWLASLDHWRGTITAAPDFGFRMATQRPPQGPLDLSTLRVAIVGGEVVRAGTLAGFTEAFSQYGVQERVMCPAYGMAELGLAATMTPPDAHWHERQLNTLALADDLLADPEHGVPATTLVASGVPLAGYQVECGAADAAGGIAVRGPSLGLDGLTGRPLAGPDGWYETGDAGFMHEGWLYVCGRRDDNLVAHGRSIYAPAVEHAVGDVAGVRTGRVTAVGLPTGDWVVVAEAASQPLATGEIERLRNEIRRAAVQAARAQPDEVRVIERGTLPLTPSGKLQRNEVRSRLLRGDL